MNNLAKRLFLMGPPVALRAFLDHGLAADLCALWAVYGLVWLVGGIVVRRACLRKGNDCARQPSLEKPGGLPARAGLGCGYD